LPPNWSSDVQVLDRVLTRPPLRARSAAARTEVFTDHHGHAITLTTDVPALDLTPYAQLLASVYHHDEIQDVLVEIVAPERIGTVCGGEEVVGCYLPEDPLRSYRGQMWIPAGSPTPSDDWIKIAIHEYGHHVDNQLLNLGDALPEAGCDFASDGSRNWFFERQIQDNILDQGTCDPSEGWEFLLGELFAEDFTWLNGNSEWREDLPVPAPTDGQLAAMADDFDSPLSDRRMLDRWRRVPRRDARAISFSTGNDWRFVTATLTGPRSADLDLYLYTRNGRRPFARSRGRTSREEIWRPLPPGRYYAVIFAYRKAAWGHLRVRFE